MILTCLRKTLRGIGYRSCFPSRSTPARMLISIIDRTAQPRTGSFEGVWFGSKIGTKPNALVRNLALNVNRREFSLVLEAAE